MTFVLALFGLFSIQLQLRAGEAQQTYPPPTAVDMDHASLKAFLMNQTLDVEQVANPCNWSVWVQCKYVPKTTGERRIRKLTISGARLNGSIPAGTIGNLKALEYLNLSHNCLLGTIPEDLWGLPNLSSLDLAENRLAGNLSPLVGKASSLRTLNLSANMLHGPIPLEIGHLSGLQHLDVGRNPLGGFIPPELFNCTRLKNLDLSDANLQGPIPRALGDVLALRDVNLSGNSLTGPVPDMSRLQRLTSFSVSSNVLSGELPTNLSGSLRTLDLSANGFEDVISNFPHSWLLLEYLDLSYIPGLGVGGFPLNLGCLSALRYLSISWSSFSAGTFPAIFELVNLTHLDLASCNLVGSLPADLDKLTNLEALNLSENNLSGVIPVQLGSLSKLTSLDLSHNSLYGSIPSQLANLTLLTNVNLSFNNLSGPILQQWTRFDDSSFEGNPLLCSGRCQRGTAGAPTFSGEPESLLPPAAHPRHRLKAGILVGIVVGSLASVVVMFALVCWHRRVLNKATSPELVVSPAVSTVSERHLPARDPCSAGSRSWLTGVKDPSTVPVTFLEKPLLTFTLADLYAATSTFSKDAQISEGRHGPVYKGILGNGVVLAIRVLCDGGFHSEQEAAAQLETLARVRHTNLVPLVGYCVVGKQRLLIYDFIVNGDLHRRLHDLPEGIANIDDWSMDTWEQLEGDVCGDTFDWHLRHKIALGLARALAFLHHGCSPHIVHCAVNCYNVLLDCNHEPYLADCGLRSLRAAGDRSSCATQSTPGYIPPEYARTSEPSTRGDVYSFGVVLLELVTGRRPTGLVSYDSCEGNLVCWVRSLIRENQGYRALDPKVTRDGPLPEMLEALRIGYLCTADEPSKRPSMHQVVRLLKDIL